MIRLWRTGSPRGVGSGNRDGLAVLGRSRSTLRCSPPRRACSSADFELAQGERPLCPGEGELAGRPYREGGRPTHSVLETLRLRLGRTEFPTHGFHGSRGPE